MKALLAVPIERVELGPHTAVVIQCVDDPSRPGQFLLDVRLDRRDTDERGRVPQPTAAGFPAPSAPSAGVGRIDREGCESGIAGGAVGRRAAGDVTPGERP